MARAKIVKMYVTKRHINFYPNQFDALNDLAEAERKQRRRRPTLSSLVREAVDEYLERRHRGR